MIMEVRLFADLVLNLLPDLPNQKMRRSHSLEPAVMAALFLQHAYLARAAPTVDLNQAYINRHLLGLQSQPKHIPEHVAHGGDLLHQAPGSHRQFGFTPKDLSPHFLTHWLLFYVVFILDDD